MACPNCGNLARQDGPCGDKCWFEMGLRELLKERSGALTPSEIESAIESAFERSDAEHPASVALHDLGAVYEVKVAKYAAIGDGNSALLLSGVLGDLKHVRGMI